MSRIPISPETHVAPKMCPANAVHHGSVCNLCSWVIKWYLMDTCWPFFVDIHYVSLHGPFVARFHDVWLVGELLNTKSLRVAAFQMQCICEENEHSVSCLNSQILLGMDDKWEFSAWCVGYEFWEGPGRPWTWFVLGIIVGETGRVLVEVQNNMSLQNWQMGRLEAACNSPRTREV